MTMEFYDSENKLESYVLFLRKEKLPSLSEVFSIVRSEETRRSVILDKGNSNTESTMVIGKGFTKNQPLKENLSQRVVVENTTHCKRLGHTNDTCYKLYGKEKVLERMSGNKGSTQMWDIQAFSKEEMDHLRALLNSTSKPLSSCGLTMKGKSSFNISCSVSQSMWILNFGVIDHMTPFSSYFTSYLKVSKKQFIIVANGDRVPIVGSGNV
ncbi:hypothetical protein CR513_13187, partial [Mucuna pruriens]